jgi:hypothetical protein
LGKAVFCGGDCGAGSLLLCGLFDETQDERDIYKAISALQGPSLVLIRVPWTPA